MFEKLFNLFRKKPAVIQEELPPVPNPTYKEPAPERKVTISCPSCKTHKKPNPRPQKSTRELKPAIRREYEPIINDDLLMNAVYLADTLGHSRTREPEQYIPVESHTPTPSHSHSSHSHDSTPSHSHHSYDSHFHSSHSHDSGSSHDSGGGCDSGGCGGGD